MPLIPNDGGNTKVPGWLYHLIMAVATACWLIGTNYGELLGTWPRVIVGVLGTVLLLLVGYSKPPSGTKPPVLPVVGLIALGLVATAQTGCAATRCERLRDARTALAVVSSVLGGASTTLGGVAAADTGGAGTELAISAASVAGVGAAAAIGAEIIAEEAGQACFDEGYFE